jgi:hypothetical protein
VDSLASDSLERNGVDALLERQIQKGEVVRDPETGAEDYFTLQARCVRKFGPAAGIYLRQLVFWTGKKSKDPNWIYKREWEIEEETGLGRRAQREARKVLGSYGVLQERYKEIPRKLFYRVDLVKLRQLLEEPGGAMNQWKRGRRYSKDHDSGKLIRDLDAETLNRDYRQVDSTDLTSEVDNTDLTSEVDSTDLTSEVDSTDRTSKVDNKDLTTQVDNRDPASEVGNRDRASKVDSTDRAITKTTSETTAVDNPNRATPETSSLDNFLESSFQEARNGHFARQEDKYFQKVKELLTSTDNKRLSSPMALRHYRDGNIGLDDVALWVSLDLTRSEDYAETLKPTVATVVEELETEAAS